jgi:hypothetical protein
MPDEADDPTYNPTKGRRQVGTLKSMPQTLKVGEHIKFDEPMDLAGITTNVRESIIVAAPVVLGRDAIYIAEFHKVAGLCNHGFTLYQLEVETPFPDDEIHAVWKHETLLATIQDL